MRIALAFLLIGLSASAFGAERGEGGLDAAFRDIPGLREFVAQRTQTKSQLEAVASDPARFIAEKTYLGSSSAFRTFLRDGAAVESFLNDQVTVFITRQGWAVKQLAGPSVVRAVIGSPAMRDGKLVSYFFTKTSLPLRLGRASGVQEALSDRAFVERLCSAELRAWLTSNPAAQAALKAQSPVAASVLARRQGSAQ